MKILGINGINTDGSTTTDRMLAVLADKYDYDVLDINQEVRHTPDIRSPEKRLEDALGIVPFVDAGDWLLVHSYGGLKGSWVERICAAREVYLAGIIYFNPAMDDDYDFPPYETTGTEHHCFYSKGDWTIFAGSLAFKHGFGPAGRSGFKRANGRDIKNYRIKGRHSASFSDKYLFERTRQVDQIIQNTGIPTVSV